MITLHESYDFNKLNTTKQLSLYTKMYLSDFTYDSSILHKFELSPRDRSFSTKVNNHNGIAPWGTGDKILGNLPSSMATKQNHKSHSSPISKSQFEHGNSLNLIDIPQKGRINRSTLGKFQKTNKITKTNQQFHLHMNQIQFRQHDRKMEIENQNQLFFKVNQKINIKDFTSLDNNFFIRSYFFPNNIKTPNKRGETESSDQKKKNQSKNIKEIQTSTFLAIKSVDLKEKFFKNQKTVNERNCQFKNERSNVQVKKHIETIEQTKQSSKENCGSFRQKSKIIVKKTDKKGKLSQGGDTIAIQPSFIRSPFDEHFMRLEQPSISTNEKTNSSKEKHLAIAGIKKLKLKTDQHNITQFIEPKSTFKPKYSTITHNFSSRQSDRPYKKKLTQSPKKLFQSNKNYPHRFRVYDQQAQRNGTTFYELTKEKTFILK